VSAMVNIAKTPTTVPAPRRSITDAGPLTPSDARRHATGVSQPTPVVHGSLDPKTTSPPGGQSSTAVRYLLAAIRLALGWIFLWAFLDKAFGLGHDTTTAKSWLNGGSPTKGFLGSAAKGPFTGFYHSIAGTGPADVLFMTALLAIGVALVLGVGIRLAAAAGALLTVMMWTVVLPPASNPFMDDHLVYAAVLVVLALLGAGNTLGFGRLWASTPLVRRAAWLR
jgi:thiosulfate dehydrogenase [quinone] large subunit